MPETRPRIMKSITKRIDARAQLQSEIDAIAKQFQPKLDKIQAKMDKRLGRRRAKVRDLTTQIQGYMFSLTGTELAALRRTYPTVPEISGRRG